MPIRGVLHTAMLVAALLGGALACAAPGARALGVG
jgi:hypothetical protein